MKLKKLFAGILAVAMMATMAAPAFAATSFSPNLVTDIELTKNYTVKQDMTAPAEKLAFELNYWKEEDVAKAGEANNIAKTATTYYADFTKGGITTLSGADNKATIGIDVTQLGINKVGKYYFKVKEVAGRKAGVTYDNRTRVLLVSAVNDVDEDGKLKSGLKYYAALYEFDEVTGDMGAKIEGSKAFDNSYDAYTIDLSKEVRGEFADRDKEFSFNVVFTPASGKTSADYVGATVVKNSTSETWAIDGTTKYPVTLKHGDHFEIKNLPEGVTYTITEEFNDGDWTTTVGSATTKEATGTIEEDTSVAYVNKHNGVPDTGVILDNAPYIALMMVVVAGAAVMIIKKRRHFED